MDPIPSGASRYIYTDVTTMTDPTGGTPSFAFLNVATNASNVQPTAWSNGEWFGAAQLLPSGRYRTRARVLAGAGGVVTATGTYHAWVKVGADFERFDTITLY